MGQYEDEGGDGELDNGLNSHSSAAVFRKCVTFQKQEELTELRQGSGL